MAQVLVTGVGGGVGQSIVKSLQATPYSVVAVDSDPLAAGLYGAQRGYTVPMAAESGPYVSRLIEIATRERCALLFPGLDAELPVLAANAERLLDAGVRVVVSAAEVVDIADDKLATARFLEARGFPAPHTVPLSECRGLEPHGALVLKPRRGGTRSRGVFVVRTPTELEHCRGLVNSENYVAQELIEGDEYTCGSVTLDGRCHGTIVMRRILRDGDTYKAFVVTDERLHAHVKAVAEALGPVGPCNVQLRVRGGTPYVFEINARCSGTTHARALAGFNEPLMTADYLLAGRLPAYAIRGITVLRYWQELVVEGRRVSALTVSGVVDGDGTRL